ncbi:hypothetical protein DEM27_10585 [Metarhizobium album]|uniref:Uncharacterized protein n=1 Tax=Metarhizobium album TaxID=2182425 RepID=A0A2U2DU12_9HYPH|nr:hypothetical protein [Rhizobium album]PWE56800.1 hypothetical protein DEM27_10585 [Rhizobium album]
MGFNTAVMVLNDRLHEIRDDPNFGEKLYHAILLAGRPLHDRPYVPQVSVLPSQHADTAQVVVISANSLRVLGYGDWQDDDANLLRKIADDMGFRLVRKTRRGAAA